jgi:hypothetical protein
MLKALRLQLKQFLWWVGQIACQRMKDTRSDSETPAQTSAVIKMAAIQKAAAM